MKICTKEIYFTIDAKIMTTINDNLGQAFRECNGKAGNGSMKVSPPIEKIFKGVRNKVGTIVRENVYFPIYLSMKRKHKQLVDN